MSSLPTESAERRKPDEPDAGDDEEDTDERFGAAAGGQRIDVDRAPAVEHDTGAHEQRPLEEGVGDNEQRSSGQGPGIEHGEPDEEQPGIADRGEGEQALQVGLHQRHHGANQCCRHADADEQRSHGVCVDLEDRCEDGPIDAGGGI